MKILLAILCGTLAVGCTPSSEQVTIQVDTDYILALSAANRFLEAWRSRHQDNGLSVLSGELIEARGEQWWRDEISGISNPGHESYEICNGQRLPDGRFIFDVWFYEYYSGERNPARNRYQAKKIVLTRVGPDQWKVDDVRGI